MDVDEFIVAEKQFKCAAEKFKKQCDDFGVSAEDSIADILIDIGFDTVMIEA